MELGQRDLARPRDCVEFPERHFVMLLTIQRLMKLPVENPCEISPLVIEEELSRG